ncbi:hypothetical protein ABPG72_015082 [Tetrahymena utriculariae]
MSDQQTKQEQIKDSMKDKKKEEEKPKVPYFSLFRFATFTDKCLMIMGAIASVINGFSFPAWSFIFGQMVDQFSPTSGYDGLIHNASVQAMWFAIIGAISLALSAIQIACWQYTGEKQAICYRKFYFQAILKQEIGWFDKNNPNQLATKIATECFAIQGAISDKVATFITTISMFFGGFIVAYLRGWLMSLVVSATIPVIFAGGMIVAVVIKKAEQVSQQAYTSAGGVAEQALNAVKTIKSLNGEDYELKNYSQKIIQAYKTNVKFSMVTGLGVGITFCCMFLAYSLSFWYGGKLINNETENSIYDRAYTSGDVMVCFFSILTGGFSLGQATPCIKDFMKGQQAAVDVFAVLDRVPLIKDIPNAKKISNLIGKFEFKNVSFSYPTKSDVKTLKNISFQVLPNQKTALVGESGCGKSTIMQLIERFYDPQEGEVILDGINVKELSLKWMRNQIGYVGQEPVLFAATVRENLQFGNLDATDVEMIEALKQANAWEFVQKLEKGLDTYVGNMGNQLSGGQKQRICIARAILKNPKILLLDEATSALDRKNEREIQETLDYVSNGRTTIVIAHRLMTVKNSNHVFVIDEGEIIEQGGFQELINKPNGKFAGLAKNQIFHEENSQNGELQEIQIARKQSSKINENNLPIRTSFKKSESINKNGQCVVEIKNEEKVGQIELTDEQIALQKKEQKKKEEKEDKAFASRLVKMNQPEQGWFILAMVITLGSGLLFPLAGLILGNFISTLSQPQDNDFIDEVNRLALYFLLLAIGSLILYTAQLHLFNRVGEGLTLRLRQETFKKMLRMPCSWFDEASNTPGTLSSKLSSDCQIINILTTNVISIQFQNLSTLLAGLIIAFVFSWRVTLVGLACMPAMMIAGALQVKFTEGFSDQTDKAYKGSGNIVTDAVTNIRTVASFANEQKIMEMMDQQLQKPAEGMKKKSIISGLMFGISQFCMFGIYALIFYVSAYFVRDYGLTIKDMYVSMFCILFAGFGIGNNNAFVGDVTAAKASARNIFKILDSEDEIQFHQRVHSPQSLKLTSHGQIVFDNVTFQYPTRDTPVFKNLSFKINQGQHIAFVGPSGCGKSTIIQILLRFYDDFTGKITIDGVDIRQYDIASLRSNFGVVFQDPILFDDSFKENIKYNTQDVTFDDIRRAAIQANAIHFIEGNEKRQEDLHNENQTLTSASGFDRKVGIKGSQISGGQKQRVAVARAILKNPKIMLLDEATSALDQDNEAILQQALVDILKNKTSITIAHRINTIKDSDIIFVLQEGKIMEQGKYDELMSQKGFFYNINHN